MSNTQGFSHFVLCASTPDKYEETITFYEAIGFQRMLDQCKTKEDNRHKVWMKLKAASQAQAADLVIKITLSEGNTFLESQQGNSESAVVILVRDMEKIRAKLDIMSVQCQSQHDRLYAHDPLGTPLIFYNKPHGLLRTDPRDDVCNEMKHFDPGKTSRRIAILTSGGDAPGMNPCVRAVVRYGISMGCDMYAVYEGYQGLVDGGERIRRMDWKSVRGWLHVGGTLIGTARCKDFQQRQGRLQAVQNLVSRGIDSLIVCGGDGSLTGADVFRAEWPSLIKELKDSGKITSELAEKHKHLTIVGLVGSIDNDMALTDITIGAVTSLHRICESVDAINTTALSHSRAFVVEVMGRHCGWLALMAGIATGADFIFIPERPPDEDWPERLCKVAQRHRDLGKRKTIVIVAEGALDTSLNPIKADPIKNILCERLGLDTRVTTLGHVQRGGSPCAADRILATVQGVQAVRAVLESNPDTESPLIGMSNNKVTCTPLMKAVELTHEVAKAIGDKNFARAMELRDPQFAEEYDAFTASTIMDDTTSLLLPEFARLRIAILHIGAPAGGMNAATRTAVRYALNRGHHPIVVYNGFTGLVRGTMEDATWIGVDGWTPRGGSELGTNRYIPGKDVDMGMIAYQIQKHQIQALIVIGGFEAYSALVELEKERQHYPSLCIPICHLPATISNNVPGTDFSLGTDTALNAITFSCDAIAQSARSSRRRVFVVEVQGGKTGYLAVEAGLASGSNTVYIPEEGISLARLQSDVKHLMALYLDDDPDKSEGRIILRTETASNTYTTEVISNILKEEGHQFFDSRTAILGHIQQGDTPSPLDRIRATRLAMRAIEFIEIHTNGVLETYHHQGKPPPVELNTCHESVAVIGLAGNGVRYSPVRDLLVETDIKNRKPRGAWWYADRDLVDLLAGRGLFTPEAQARIHEHAQEEEEHDKQERRKFERRYS